MPQPPLHPCAVPDDGGSRPATVVEPTSFLDRVYDEAHALLIETRNYFAYREAADVRHLETDARLLVSQETMRITCRLTQVMAWLFCQKAVQNGERPREWAMTAENALSGERVCLEDRFADDDRLPAAIRSLQERSLRLYQRIARLEAMMKASEPVSADP